MTWLLSFGFLYCISLRHLAADAALTQFWRSYAAFMPMLPLRAAAWTLRAFVLMFHNPVGLVGPLTTRVGLVVFVAGCLSFVFRRWQLAIVLLAPFPIVVLAS